jgi:hypothetical protein
MTPIADQRLMGNVSGVTATPSPVTPTQAKAMLGYRTEAEVASAIAAYAQPLDSDLSAIAALTTTEFGRSLLTQADGVAVRTAIGASDLPRIENRQSLRDFFAGLYAFRANPTTNRIGIACYGDSVSEKTSFRIANYLWQNGYHEASFSYPPASGLMSLTTSGAALIYRGDTRAVISQSNMTGSDGGVDFTYLPSGMHWTLANGSVATFGMVDYKARTAAKVYLATGPGFGSVVVDLMVGGSVVQTQTVSLSAGSLGATKVDFTGLDPASSHSIRITSTGVSVVLYVGFMAASGVCFLYLNRGGSSLNQNHYSNETILRYILSDLNVKLICTECKEEGTQAHVDAAIARLAAIPNCSSLVFASAPDVTSEAGQLERGGWFRTAAMNNGVAFFDAYKALKNYAELQRLGWEGDGTHLDFAAYDYIASLVLAELHWEIGNRVIKTVDTGASREDYVASRSIRIQRQDDSLRTTEILRPAAVSPTLGEIANVLRILFDNDGTTRAHIASRDATSVAITSTSGAVGGLYASSLESPSAIDNVLFAANGGATLGRDLVMIGTRRGIRYVSTTGPLDTGGTGSPEGVVTAPPGSTYRRTDGGEGTSFYFKESGTGNTGWVTAFFSQSARTDLANTFSQAQTFSNSIRMSAGSSSSAALQFSANAGTGIHSLASGLAMALTCNGLVNSALGQNSFNINDGVFFGFSSGNPEAVSADVNLSRNAAGVMQLGTTAKNALGSLLLTNLTASGTLQVGGGAVVQNILSATATLDFASIAASSFQDLTITVTGAVSGDTVIVNPIAGSATNDVVYTGWVSASNTVTIRASNASSTTARDPASGTFRATVIRF